MVSYYILVIVVFVPGALFCCPLQFKINHLIERTIAEVSHERIESNQSLVVPPSRVASQQLYAESDGND